MNTALKLVQCRFPSVTHEKAWKKFEPEVLYTRTMMFLTVRILQSALFLAIGAETYQLSEKYLNQKEQEIDEDGASVILPWAKTFLNILMLVRVIIFMLAIRYPCLTRASFYLELVIQIIESFLPIDVASTSLYVTARMMAVCIIFVANYFNFWIDLVCSLMALLSIFIGRGYILGDEDGLLIPCFFVLLFL